MTKYQSRLEITKAELRICIAQIEDTLRACVKLLKELEECNTLSEKERITS